MRRMTVSVDEQTHTKLQREASESVSSARPIVTVSDVSRELLSRPLHVDARARRSVARVPTGPAADLLRRASEAVCPRLSIVASDRAVTIVTDDGDTWATFPVTDQRGLESAHREARLAMDLRHNARSLAAAFANGGA